MDMTIIALCVVGLMTLASMKIAYDMGHRDGEVKGRLFAVEEYLEHRRNQTWHVTWGLPVEQKSLEDGS